MTVKVFKLLAITIVLVTICVCGSRNTSSQRRSNANAPANGVLTGQGALGDWTTDRPGVRRRGTIADLPKPFATDSGVNGPKLVKRPPDACPHGPEGFNVEEFLGSLS